MYMILVVLIVVGATAYVWCTRGFFSGFVHMLCVIAAGAIAFGLWDMLAELLRDNAPDRGTFSFLSGAAMGIALAIPFAVCLAILRGIVDKILPANAQCEKVADYIGGGVCGVIAGVISAGIVVISAGLLRVESDFLGYASVSYTGGIGRGSLERNKGTMVPWVDRIVAGMYSHLSTTTLRTADPLAKWYPDLVSYPGELRMTFDGKSRNTITSKDVNLLSWYTVGDTAKGTQLRNLLKDTWTETPQKISDMNGDEFTGNYYLAGFTAKFKASAREKTGSVFVGNGQVRLVVASADDEENPETRALHPVAMVGRVDSTTQVAFSRFRYDSDTFFSSVGAESEPVMAFEFPVEVGFKPIALYIKGVRFKLDEPPNDKPFKEYPSTGTRDSEIEAGDFPNMGGVGPILDENGVPLKEAPGSTPGPVTSPVLVSNAIGRTLQKGTEGPNITIVDEGKGWMIQDGRTTLATNRMNTQGLEKPLRIDKFAIPADTAMVKVLMTTSKRSEDFVKALENVDPSAVPLLEDANGTTYQAVGYIYQDPTKYEIVYTQANPIKKIGDVPRVTRNTPDKELTLLFIVNNGVDLRSFKIGDVELDHWPSTRPFHVDAPRAR